MKRIFIMLMVVLLLVAATACAKEEPHALLELAALPGEGGSLELDKTEIWDKEEEVVFTLRPDADQVPYALYFKDETGATVTATYPATDEFALQADGSYRVKFTPGLYYHLHTDEEEFHAHGHDESEWGHIPQGTVVAEYIPADSPRTTVAKVQDHSQITVFPEQCRKGTNVKIVIALEKGYEVTYCDHNGTAFPVEEPLATYSDMEYDYVSFSFYMKEADEVVTYEVAEKK